MRLLICGSRGWKDEQAVAAIILGYQKASDNGLTVIHGHCKSGADAIADKVAFKLGVPVVRVPANWQQLGRAAGPIRNQKMLDEQKPHVVVAFRSKGKSNGTDDMCARAKKRGIPVYVITAETELGTDMPLPLEEGQSCP